MDVVILGGGATSPQLRALSGAERRSDLRFGGRTMLAIAEQALAPFGEPIVVGGPLIAAGGSFIDSLARGVERVKAETFLLSTADLPFLTTEAVGDFVARCDPKALVNYPIVPVALCEQRFPKFRRTTLCLREGRYTGGNLGLMSTAMMRQALPILERAYSARKSPLRLAGMVGYGTLFRVLLGRAWPRSLSLTRLERGVTGFLGAPVKAIVSHYPEVATDIDSADQYRALSAVENAVNSTEA